MLSYGIPDGCEMLGEPAFVEQEPPVGWGQDVALHEQVAQVGGRAPVLPLPQALVADRDATARQALQETDDVGATESDQPALRAGELQEEVHEGCRLWVDLTGTVVEEVGERSARVQRLRSRRPSSIPSKPQQSQKKCLAFRGMPPRADLEWFFLDDADRELVSPRRRERDRLGFAVQMTRVRYPGAFWTDESLHMGQASGLSLIAFVEAA
ncbi:DUF4158 domain-containing protein [Streptomyces sp. NPDC127066]|uniref:DUF4158 domain-containing protein n=1 Tax=Streptomyces sp. NPDC127066 TaxID=3347125 RepID=UPI00365A1B27